MAKIKNFDFSEGETWIIRMAARDATGEAFDLTGGSAAWAISIENGALVLLIDGVITDAEAGLVDFIVSPDEHLSVTEGEYLYEMRVTLSNGIISTQIKGRLTVGESPFAASVFGGSVRSREIMAIALSDEVNALTVGSEIAAFHLPWPFVFLEVFTGISVVSASGSVTVDAKKNGVSIFSQRPAIGEGLDTSIDSVPAILSTTSALKLDRISFDIVSAGSGAKGLKIYMLGYEVS